MGEGTQKLTVEAEAKGFGKAAQDVTQVSQAEEQLKDQTAESTKATREKWDNGSGLPTA